MCLGIKHHVNTEKSVTVKCKAILECKLLHALVVIIFSFIMGTLCIFVFFSL